MERKRFFWKKKKNSQISCLSIQWTSMGSNNFAYMDKTIKTFIKIYVFPRRKSYRFGKTWWQEITADFSFLGELSVPWLTLILECITDASSCSLLHNNWTIAFPPPCSSIVFIQIRQIHCGGSFICTELRGEEIKRKKAKRAKHRGEWECERASRWCVERQKSPRLTVNIQ